MKELELIKGRATGISTIKRVLESNGSHAPTFKTDDERSLFEVEIFCHPAFLEDSSVGSDQAEEEPATRAHEGST
ncbi:hypothetical protein I0P70_12630 [Pontibacter sp. FD36]|uniref:hypothetical protein n=1 Tax=Pontibacter sp. FD36 TaxID=2789860 RepID=UPI0018A969F8|nr:hypothetical protein [Pontibacter sp. FD36]MBF8964093.1 hypothetical protein [Pontibacter sp. FD36]